MNAQSTRSIRRRQLSVRSLLLFVSAAAIFFAWFGWRLRLGHRRDAAVEKIVRAGGDAAYASQFDGHYSRQTTGTYEPSAFSALLERLFGTDPFRQLMAVRVSDPKSVKIISEYKLTGLEILALRDSGIADPDTVHIRDCKRLKVLTLDNTPVSDRSIDNILECRQLEQLYLRNTKVTEEGVKKLSRLPRLSMLDISGTPISGDGLKVVATLPSVSLLCFDDAALTTEELRNLRTAPSLKHLWLGDQPAANVDL
jgi:Leucine-rich repeat (LRR) protein